jgi:hypothetical protein
MDGKTLLLILAGFAVVTAGLVLAVRLGHRYGGDVDLVRGRRARPWWGHPGFWLVASAAFVFLGLFVFPKLFGLTFVFLPFLWVGGGLMRSRSRGDPPPRPDPEDRP